MSAPVPPAFQVNVRFTPEHWEKVPRSLVRHHIERIEKRDEDWVQIYLKSGDVFMRRTSAMEHFDKLHANLEVHVQIVLGSWVTGLFIPMVGWAFKMTNEELAMQARETSQQNYERRTERLAANRAQYQSREADLPDWLKARITYFRAMGPEQFEMHGWEYELTTCELAAAMDSGVDDKAFAELAKGIGATANQVGCAAAIVSAARELQSTDAALKIPAAMSPITGRPDYNLG